MTESPHASGASFRVGHGYDLHRLDRRPPLGAGKPFILGGVRIPADRGPVAHSDGDVLLHAVTDAILGALAFPDIGQLFPDTDAAHADADSGTFLAEAVRRAAAAGWRVVNLDATVILEGVKIAPVKEAVRARLASMVGVPEARVNVKGKSHERVDAVGEGRAVEAHAVVLMERVPDGH
ncbi:MAG: 2-C-methyl-D-erythritol 2,4-cyclodiphosphate synthase [Phycisphaerae bacterium]|nr:MAG: 2-C-methyl-D-erythritol 2,4-cyclodiphosphate synthase [Phycisphaerae bacterium]